MVNSYNSGTILIIINQSQYKCNSTGGEVWLKILIKEISCKGKVGRSLVLCLRRNLIIMKFSRRGKFVMFENKHKLLFNGYSVPYVKDGISWVFMDFDRFWAINKDGVKKCSES